ncbi:hypothetical protein [Paenibacillus sp. Y412MC10]|uniref:hypothetical protein n=1 Tax=Geobacillus sp. (strain Y412MC10) TaxID=481743 RepID=UPI0011AB8539|nr:hypothetical protein [Paenibacillus sp. Y412MC10]
MRKTMIEKLKAEIERKQKLGFMDDVAEKSQRLKDLRRLWSKFGSDSLVLQMKDVVETYVSHYEIDFYYHDRADTFLT